MNLVAGVTDASTGQHRLMAAVVEPFSAGVRRLAYSIVRVALAAMVVRGFVLCSAADDVDDSGTPPSDVEVTGPATRGDMIEMG